MTPPTNHREIWSTSKQAKRNHLAKLVRNDDTQSHTRTSDPRTEREIIEQAAVCG